MIFLEVCFMSQEPSTNDNKYSQTAAEKHVQKIPVVRVVHSIQGEKKEKVKHDQKEESDEGHGEEERQMRRTVKIAVKLGEDKGDQEKETLNATQESLCRAKIAFVENGSSRPVLIGFITATHLGLPFNSSAVL